MTELLDVMQACDPEVVEDEALKEACSQLQDLRQLFLVLLGELGGEEGRGALDTLSQSTGKGALPLVKRAVSNSEYYGGLEQQMRRSLLALKTMLPDVLALMKRLQGEACE